MGRPRRALGGSIEDGARLVSVVSVEFFGDRLSGFGPASHDYCTDRKYIDDISDGSYFIV